MDGVRARKIPPFYIMDLGNCIRFSIFLVSELSSEEFVLLQLIQGNRFDR